MVRADIQEDKEEKKERKHDKVMINKIPFLPINNKSQVYIYVSLGALFLVSFYY